MSRTYKATGINLKGMPLGEYDRLLTILTPEFGVIRAVAPGARKHKSQFAGRSGLFVVNQLLIAQGRDLDKITQAQTLESYPGLSANLTKLTASQYLAELVLLQALSGQPQEELYELLSEHLRRLENAPLHTVIAHLTQAVFHLLAIAGIGPQVQLCCITQQPLTPDFTNPNWYVGFNVLAGGTVMASAIGPQTVRKIADRLPAARPLPQAIGLRTVRKIGLRTVRKIAQRTEEEGAQESAKLEYDNQSGQKMSSQRALHARINATELALLQQLAAPELPKQKIVTSNIWRRLEQILRQYAEYHFDRQIRAAALIDTCFPISPTI
ncbi:MAG: DNA repair protein RecO [Hormoscilla sp. SP5CHS1]|nr:DNA repair protein RecO [Hormoscilla sp. SP12CHS1]MBC6456099.1 DNA repair protein RecO [Hormoscilla sp. SP5CHS1]